MRKYLALAVCVSLAGCATSPNRIKPAAVDSQQYTASDCADLAAQAQHTQRELDRYVSSQYKTRVGDAIVWPIPISRIFGKNRRNVRMIAQLRGDLLAINETRAAKQCPVSPMVTP